jgi:hypothetical protein
MKNKNIIKILITLNILIIFSMSIYSATYDQFENNIPNKILEYTQNFGTLASDNTFVNISKNECADDARVTLIPSPIEAENASADIVLVTDLSKTMKICMEGEGLEECDEPGDPIYWGSLCNLTHIDYISEPSECNCSEYDELGICRIDPHFTNGTFNIMPMNHNLDVGCFNDTNYDFTCSNPFHIGVISEYIINYAWRNNSCLDWRRVNPIDPNNQRYTQSWIYDYQSCSNPGDIETGMTNETCYNKEDFCLFPAVDGPLIYHDELKFECDTDAGEIFLNDITTQQDYDPPCPDGWTQTGLTGDLVNCDGSRTRINSPTDDICTGTYETSRYGVYFDEDEWILMPDTCENNGINNSDPYETRVSNTCVASDVCDPTTQTEDGTDDVCITQEEECESGDTQTITYDTSGFSPEDDPDDCLSPGVWTGDTFAGENCIDIDSDDFTSCSDPRPIDDGLWTDTYDTIETCPDGYDTTENEDWQLSSTCTGMLYLGDPDDDISTGTDCQWMDSCDSARPQNTDTEYRSTTQSTPCTIGDQTEIWDNEGWYLESDGCPTDYSPTGSTRNNLVTTWEEDSCQTGQTPTDENRLVNCQYQTSCSAPLDTFNELYDYENCEAQWDCGTQSDQGTIDVEDQNWRNTCDSGRSHEIRANSTSRFLVTSESACSSPNFFNNEQLLENERLLPSIPGDPTIYCKPILPHEEQYTCYDIRYECFLPEYRCIDEMQNCCDELLGCCEYEVECEEMVPEIECGELTYQCSRDMDLCCNNEYRCVDYTCTNEYNTCCNELYECGEPEYECCHEGLNCCFNEVHCGRWFDWCCETEVECEAYGENCSIPTEQCCYEEKECLINEYYCEQPVDNCCDSSCENDTTSNFPLDYTPATNFGCPAVTSLNEGGFTNTSFPNKYNSCLDSDGNETFYCELIEGREGSCDEYTCTIVREKLAKFLDKDFVLNVTDEDNENIKIALISYDTTANVDQSLTHNTTKLINKIDNYQASSEQNSKTCISCALRSAIDQLLDHGSPLASKSIVLMTDGVANRLLDGTDLIPSEYYLARNEIKNIACNETDLTSAEQNQIRIYTIAFGEDASDIETLQNISACTNGTFYQSSDSEGLKAIYEDIQGRINESNPIPRIDINNDNTFDFDMDETQLQTPITWDNSACGSSEASCGPLSTVLNYGLSYCNNDNGVDECNIDWNVSSLTPGNLTLNSLHINTFVFSTGPQIVYDSQIEDAYTIDCEDFINNGDCGNGDFDPDTEQCDDGCNEGDPNICDDADSNNGDGCSQYCTIENINPGPNPENCERFPINIHENQRYLFNANLYVDDLDDADYDLTWTWNQITNTKFTIKLDTYQPYNIIELLPENTWNGWEEVNFTVTDDDGQYDIACINFTVAPVPDYDVTKINTTRLLISKGKMITGYNENVAGEIQSWGPYLVTIKVWEKDTRKND